MVGKDKKTELRDRQTGCLSNGCMGTEPSAVVEGNQDQVLTHAVEEEEKLTCHMSTAWAEAMSHMAM